MGPLGALLLPFLIFVGFAVLLILVGSFAAVDPLVLVGLVALAIGLACYFRLGTVRGTPVRVQLPVVGRNPRLFRGLVLAPQIDRRSRIVADLDRDELQPTQVTRLLGHLGPNPPGQRRAFHQRCHRAQTGSSTSLRRRLRCRLEVVPALPVRPCCHGWCVGDGVKRGALLR